MAEKEERIYIEYFKDDPCKNCDAAEVGYCVDEDKGHGCLDKSNYIYGISRYEAICKIGRAICRAGGNECIGDCESCDLWEVGPEKDYAEAALNALLGEK